MSSNALTFKNMDIPLSPEPYKDIAAEQNSCEEEIIIDILSAIGSGSIKRFGAVLNHAKAGYTFNTLVAWEIPEEKIDQVGKKLASFHSISHCYRRETAKNWPYNLYTMVHAKDANEKEQILETLKTEAKKISSDFKLKELPTLKEFKKTSFEP